MAGGDLLGDDRGSNVERSVMRLLGRKSIPRDDASPRCPLCMEKVPEGATECAMCGVDLRPLRASARPSQTDEVRSGG
jgi:hypothetical protein